MTYAICAAAIVAFIVIAGVIESRRARRDPLKDFNAAWDHGHANDLKALRLCWNQRALQTRTVRSISGVRG